MVPASLTVFVTRPPPSNTHFAHRWREAALRLPVDAQARLPRDFPDLLSTLRHGLLSSDRLVVPMSLRQGVDFGRSPIHATRRRVTRRGGE